MHLRRYTVASSSTNDSVTHKQPLTGRFATKLYRSYLNIGNLFFLTSRFQQSDRYKTFTQHDSCAVVACAKSCSDLMANSRITTMQSFHPI